MISQHTITQKTVFLIGTRFFGVLGPCKILINTLLERGFEVYVFARSDEFYQRYLCPHPKLHLIQIPIRRSYSSWFYDLFCILLILYYAYRTFPRYLHSFNPKPGLIATAVKLLYPFARLNIGVTGLGNTFIRLNLLQTSLLQPFFFLQSYLCTYCFFQNPTDKQLFIDKYGLPSCKAKIFPGPGLDTLSFFPSRSLDRRSLSTPSQPLRILCVGRLLYQKGFSHLFRLFDSYKLNRSMLCEFTLVGSLDSEHPDRIPPAIFNSYLSHSTTWIPWSDDMLSIYNDHDLLLFLSEREGGPRAILEASGCGIPSIAANSPGVDQFIQDGRTGFLVNPSDIDSIYDKISIYSSNRMLLIEHGSAAHKLVTSNLTLEQATAAQLEMYH